MKKENKKLIVSLAMFVVFCAGIVIADIYRQQMIFLVSILGIVVSIISSAINAINIASIKAYEKYKKDIPYGFDQYEEYRAYRQAGESKTAKYANYKEWKNHILDHYRNLKTDDNKENFRRFMVKQCRKYEDVYSVTTSITIPAIIAVTTVFYTISRERGLSDTGMILIIIIVEMVSCCLLVRELLDAKAHIEFMKDCLELLE